MSRWTLHPALRWSFSQLGGHRRQVLLVLAATVVFTACFLAYPLLFKFAIDAAASGLSPATVRNQSLLVLLAGAGAALSYTLLQYARVLLKVQLAQRLRCTLFERFLTSSLSTYLHLPSGDLVVRLGDDLHTYSWLLSSGLFRIVQQLAALALGIPLMLWLDPLLCTTLLVPLVLIVLIYHGWERRFMRLSREIRLTKSELSERITSCFDGIWLIKAYQAEQPQGEVFEQVLGRKRDLELEFMRATLSLHTIYSFMGELGMVVLLLVGGAAVSSGRLTLGDFVAFTNYLWLLVWPMMEVVGFLARLNEMKSRGERLGELEQQADAPLGPRKPVARPGSPPFRSVRAEGLRFRYPGSDQEVFRELDFTLTAGERVLLTGPVGSGKSTLFSLLLGLYPTERLLLDDSPVPHWDPHLLRRGYRYTPQEPRLFSATIEENLVLGRPPLGKAEEKPKIVAVPINAKL